MRHAVGCRCFCRRDGGRSRHVRLRRPRCAADASLLEPRRARRTTRRPMRDGLSQAPFGAPGRWQVSCARQRRARLGGPMGGGAFACASREGVGRGVRPGGGARRFAGALLHVHVHICNVHVCTPCLSARQRGPTPLQANCIMVPIYISNGRTRPRAQGRGDRRRARPGGRYAPHRRLQDPVHGATTRTVWVCAMPRWRPFVLGRGGLRQRRLDRLCVSCGCGTEEAMRMV